MKEGKKGNSNKIRRRRRGKEEADKRRDEVGFDFSILLSPGNSTAKERK